MKRRVLIGGGITIGAVVMLVAIWYLFIRSDAPDAVSTRAGLEQLQADLSVDPGNAVEDPSVTLANPVNGTWTVDDEFGSFDFDTASGSFAGFRVNEELTLGTTEAVGRSGGVTGSLTITDNMLTSAEITIDMTTIVSDRSRRERAIRSAVAADEFPTAMFVLTKPIDLDVTALEAGSTVTVEAVGDLSIKGKTNEVAFELDATLADAGVGLVVGSIDIIWDDFGIAKPSAPIVVSIADEGVVEFQLVVTGHPSSS